MTNANESETPIAQTGGHSATSIASPEVGEQCLEIIEAFRRSSRTPTDKAGSIRELVVAITSATPQFTEAECDDAINTYLCMLEQVIIVDRNESGEQESEHHETQENTQSGGRPKRARSPGAADEFPKKQKQDDSDFPWAVREQLSESGLGDSLEATLRLLKAFARDLKFTKSSLINSAQAPPFPHSEWSNVIASSMVDLNHVILGSFAVTSDNREVKTLGGMEVKFGVTKPVKHVKTSGDWFIAWGSYANTACYVFPHRRGEFDSYGRRILSLFSATAPASYAAIVNLDKSIRARVGECRNLLFTDPSAFEDLSLYWLNPLGAGAVDPPWKPDRAKRLEFCENELCRKWNANDCNKQVSDCKYRHVCELCGKNHRKRDCKTERGTT